MTATTMTVLLIHSSSLGQNVQLFISSDIFCHSNCNSFTMDINVVGFHGQPDLSVRPNYQTTRLSPPSPVVIQAELIKVKTGAVCC